MRSSRLLADRSLTLEEIAKEEKNGRVLCDASIPSKATKDSEAGKIPSEELLSAMAKFNEEMVKAGVMLDGNGLQPSSKGARVRFSGDKRSVMDGPFAETKEHGPFASCPLYPR